MHSASEKALSREESGRKMKAEEAWYDFRADMLTDPVRRYSHDDREIFIAGWKAAQRRNTPAMRESVWYPVPSAPDDDPE